MLQFSGKIVCRAANRATIKITDHDDSGGADALDDVAPRQFEKRAEQIGFTKPLVNEE